MIEKTKGDNEVEYLQKDLINILIYSILCIYGICF